MHTGSMISYSRHTKLGSVEVLAGVHLGCREAYSHASCVSKHTPSGVDAARA